MDELLLMCHECMILQILPPSDSYIWAGQTLVKLVLVGVLWVMAVTMYIACAPREGAGQGQYGPGLQLYCCCTATPRGQHSRYNTPSSIR
jgi:hypothetical protein